MNHDDEELVVCWSPSRNAPSLLSDWPRPSPLADMCRTRTLTKGGKREKRLLWDRSLDRVREEMKAKGLI